MRPARTQSLKHPAFVFFLAVWGAGALWLLATGFVTLAGAGAAALLVVVGWSLLTVRLTEPDPRPPDDPLGAGRREMPGEPKARHTLHIAIVLLFVLLTAHQGLAFHGLLPEAWRSIPGWTALGEATGRLAGELSLPATYLRNPIGYFLLPFLALLAAGVGPGELGFRRAHRPWRVLLLWSLFNAAAVVFALATGSATPSAIGRSIAANTFQNGFFEEFLFRGALLTRLSAALGARWGLVVSSLVFGVWHAGAASGMVGDVGPGSTIAASVALQSLGGLALGVVFLRTRSLLAPSILHVIFNLP